MTTVYMADQRHNIANREQWLEALTAILRYDFEDAGFTLPPDIRFSCGFPSVRPSKVIGQCWPKEAAFDRYYNIFISPVLDDSLRVGDVLVHQLCHAATPGTGHRGPFRKCARAIGLEGKLTATTAGPELATYLHNVTQRLGPYPHGHLALRNPAIKKQDTRMIKLECPNCGYIIRTTQKWLEEAGAPICPTDNTPFERQDE